MNKIIKKVLIVYENGQDAPFQSEGGVEAFTVSIKDLIEKSALKGGAYEEVFEVEVIESLEKAITLCMNDRIDCIFFVSLNILQRARQELMRLRSVTRCVPKMVLCTVPFPREEVIIIRRQWIDEELLRGLICG